MFERVAIAGVGLIGGSLGMALRARGLAREVVGIVRREATLEEAILAGAIDSGAASPAAAAGADLVVLAAPVLTCEPLLATLAPHVAAGAIVTDVGSTKARLTCALPALLPQHADFVGGHPMAGSEQGGVLAGRADLFEGAVWVLTRGTRTRGESVERMAALVRAVGATPIEMEPDLHDAAVARISHLPHVAAAALAEAVGMGGLPGDVLRLLVAGGFRSTTRIAASPPEMWRDICLTNREAVLEALGEFDAALSRFRGALQAEDGEALLHCFTEGKRGRDHLCGW